MDRIKKSLSLIVWSFLILSQKNFAGAEEIDWTMTTKEESEQIETASKIIENPWLVDSTALNQSIEQLKEIQSKYSSTTSKKNQLKNVQPLIQKLEKIAKKNNELVNKTAPTEDYVADITNLCKNGTKIAHRPRLITRDVFQGIVNKINTVISHYNLTPYKTLNPETQEILNKLIIMLEEINVISESKRRLNKKLEKANRNNKKIFDNPIKIPLTIIYNVFEECKKEKEEAKAKYLQERLTEYCRLYEAEKAQLRNEFENKITRLENKIKKEEEDKIKKENSYNKFINIFNNKKNEAKEEIETLNKKLEKNEKKLEENEEKIKELQTKNTGYLHEKNTVTETIFEKNKEIEKLTNIMIGGAIVGGFVCVVAGYKFGYKIGALKNSPELSQENPSLPNKKIIHTILPTAQQKKLQHVL